MSVCSAIAAGVLFPFPLVFGGLLPPAMGVAPLGSHTVVVGRDFLVWDGDPGVLQASDVGCERFYGPAASPDGEAVAVWAGADRTNCIVVIRAAGVSVMGPYEKAGLPCWDGEGNLWFTGDGSLLRNGESAGLLDAHHISVSPEGENVVFTNRSDLILTMDLQTGSVDTVSAAHRFYGPFFIPSGGVVSPSLDGGIWLFQGTAATYVDHGEHPAWWPEGNGLLYIRSTDDGMNLTSSDIWFWTRSAGAVQLTATPYILETNPVPSPGGILFVDAFSGLVGQVQVSP